MSDRAYDPTDLPGQRDDKREEDARKRAARQTEIGDLKWLMSSPRGRRIVWRLLDLAGPFRMSFNTNAMQMAFNEGNRNLGLRLFNEVMTLCPELYPVMVKEQQNDRDGNGDQSN
jgi:hypothetical protein